jgi:hypothetical protein
MSSPGLRAENVNKSVEWSDYRRVKSEATNYKIDSFAIVPKEGANQPSVPSWNRRLSTSALRKAVVSGNNGSSRSPLSRPEMIL